MFKITKISKREDVNEAFNKSNHKVRFALKWWFCVPLTYIQWYIQGCIVGAKAAIKILKEGNYGMTYKEYIAYFSREYDKRTDELINEKMGR